MFNRIKQGMASIRIYLGSQAQSKAELSFPARCANVGIDASKLPVIFLDAISWEIMDQIVMLDRTGEHAIDPKTTNITEFHGINPFSNENLNLVTSDLEMNFQEHEICQIIEILNDIQHNEALRIGPKLEALNLCMAIVDFKLNAFDDFDIKDFIFLEKYCRNDFPVLLQKIDLYIKKKLENQLHKQRETFITHKENIHKLKELREAARRIHPMNEEQRFNLFLLNLELIGEYAAFIESTKATINSIDASSNDKLQEIKRVLIKDYNAYNNEVTAFIQWATAAEIRLSSYEKTYLEDQLKGAVIPFYGNLVKEKVADYERKIALQKIHLSTFKHFTHFKLQQPKQLNLAEANHDGPKPS